MNNSVGNVSLIDRYKSQNQLQQQAVNAPERGATSPILSQESNYRYAPPIDEAGLNIHKAKDEIMPSDPITKLRVNIEKASNIPQYAVRGLKGDQNANFYEYLTLAKFPYYVGGPMLAAMFMAGAGKHNLQSHFFAKQKAKQVAIGVALYYVAASLANKVIDIPVKLARGIDLNHPYRDVVDLRAVSPSGISPKKKEYHKVYESIDFTRWDLLYKDGGKPNEINERYNKIAKKYGVKENLADSDSLLKEKIKQTITMARAWKYAMIVPFAPLALGIASQNNWTTAGKNLIPNIADSFKNMRKDGFKSGLKQLGLVLNNSIVTPLKNSVKDLWKGSTPVSKVLGRSVIVASVFLPVFANILILAKTSARREKTVDVSHYNEPVKGGK